MKLTLLALLLITGCSYAFPIGNGVSVKKITIEPNKEWKGVRA